MLFFPLVRTGLLSSIFALSAFGSISAHAVMPTNPVTDREFLRLPDGKNLHDVKVKGVALSLTRGSGGTFGTTARAAYEKIKATALNDVASKVQFTMMDLDSHQIVLQSLGSHRRIFGASVAKVFCGGTILDKQNGVLNSSQMQLMADMIVISSNTAWTTLQRQIGAGDANKGRAGIYAFTQRMGYKDTMGFQGSWGAKHGNELTAADLAEYMHDTYMGAYPGAETLWKIMHTGRTGYSRGKKYIPNDIYVGGKTGTYDGPTSIDGKAVSVRVRNHNLLFNVGGHQYALAILADTGSDESAAVLAGGLLRDYTSYRP